MGTSAIIFYTIAAIMIVFSLLAVTARKILRAAVYLLFALGGTAAIYFMMDYFFLAAVQLIVYAGGIVVLIIFSILLTSHIEEKMQKPDTWKIILTSILGFGGTALCLFVITNHLFVAHPATGAEATMATIGEKLLGYGEGGYVLPFEVISILLLAAMIGAIVVAKRNKPKGNG
ncbi:MAG TPA: NADH-quinone oxidoreductase subunit J [Cyclobacteriaceae bacterium]|nr:NADH-quinone oxidoreductase subunit J [Cyclobacteriaceae bacterium]HNP07018.1 NADH-quinone oxidoreductase subunit J [Cyclobacteriaceae bacterium]